MEKVTVFKIIDSFKNIKDNIKEKEYSLEYVIQIMETELKTEIKNINNCAFDYYQDILEVIQELMEEQGYSFNKHTETFIKGV